MKEACEILTVLLCSFIICVTIAGITKIVRRVRIGRYCDMLGIGCIITEVMESENPFVEPIVSEYEVVDKKWDRKGDCWVQLHLVQDKSSRFDLTKKVAELYDGKYKIRFQRKAN